VFYPTSYSSLCAHLVKLSDHEKIKYYRDLNLLPKKGYCLTCKQETELLTPKNDEEVKKCTYTMCKTRGCTAKSYNYKRTLNFKRGSIFAHHTQTNMDLIVSLIVCFMLMLPPNVAALIVGFGISADTVGRVYGHIRKACQYYNNTHHRTALGGYARPGDQLFKHAVLLEGHYRLVVEYDESKSVCVCVCVCV
jgi:hypothetical protein